MYILIGDEKRALLNNNCKIHLFVCCCPLDLTVEL